MRTAAGSQRIYGTGPLSLVDKMVEQTYKYDSGSKGAQQPTCTRTRIRSLKNHAGFVRAEFKQLPTMHIGNTCDAVLLKAKHYRPKKDVLAPGRNV